MNNPKVSIIILTYNRTEPLKKAIESALNQTYKNLEVIVVDDNCNKPEIREWVEILIKQYPQILYIQNDKHLGVGLTANKGIEKASGEFIAFLGDDNYFEPEKIRLQMECYQSHADDKVGLVYCNESTVSMNGKVIDRYEHDWEGIPFFEHMLKDLAGMSLWLVPKHVLVEVGLLENVLMKHDAIPLLKILAAGYQVYRVPQLLVSKCENRDNRENRTSETGEKNIEALLLFRTWARKYYEELINMQIDQVEYSFSRQLVTLYSLNHKIEKARIEYEIMRQMKYFNTQTFIAFLKITFPKAYSKWSAQNRKKERRMNDLD